MVNHVRNADAASRAAHDLFAKARRQHPLYGALRKSELSAEAQEKRYEQAAKKCEDAAISYLKAGDFSNAAKYFSKSGNILLGFTDPTTDKNGWNDASYWAARNYLYAAVLYSRIDTEEAVKSESIAKGVFKSLGISDKIFKESRLASGMFVHSIASGA